MNAFPENRYFYTGLGISEQSKTLENWHNTGRSKDEDILEYKNSYKSVHRILLWKTRNILITWEHCM